MKVMPWETWVKEGPVNCRPLVPWPTTGLPSTSVPLVQSEDSSESKDGPSGPSRKLAQHQLIEGISTERKNSITSVGNSVDKKPIIYLSSQLRPHFYLFYS